MDAVETFYNFLHLKNVKCTPTPKQTKHNKTPEPGAIIKKNQAIVSAH